MAAGHRREVGSRPLAPARGKIPNPSRRGRGDLPRAAGLAGQATSLSAERGRGSTAAEVERAPIPGRDSHQGSTHGALDELARPRPAGRHREPRRQSAARTRRFLKLRLGRKTASGARVLRGGSWNNNTNNLRCANRNNNNPVNDNNNIGFRSARGTLRGAPSPEAHQGGTGSVHGPAWRPTRKPTGHSLFSARHARGTNNTAASGLVAVGPPAAKARAGASFAYYHNLS